MGERLRGREARGGVVLQQPGDEIDEQLHSWCHATAFGSAKGPAAKRAGAKKQPKKKQGRR